MPEFAASVAAQRNIYIIPEPGRQRNMPSAPEFFHRRRQIGTFEICHKVNIKQFGCSDCDIGVTGKIAVDLHCKKKHYQYQIESAIPGQIGIDLINIDGSYIGYDQLLKVAGQHQFGAVKRFFFMEKMSCLDLGQKIFGSLNRSGYQLWKKRHKRRIRCKTALCFYIPSIDIYDITQGLKRIEGYPHRQKQVQCNRMYRQRYPARYRSYVLKHEIEIFKHK